MANWTEQPIWHRSSRCSNGTCVEVARAGGDYLIRDSKQPEAEPLRFSADEWHAFCDAVRSGEFDLR
ncbi:DUF397 domain-containing protein [Actinoplanes sp. NPDC049316]|uniref:DUF397 domain-containing protein n=1 Tax=Actinoplanes sp. NPDC049316 TaxID=3154727 RepID=UPI003445789B